jgi:conjugative relaxase-like TrwC/TraI family protein
MRASEAKRPNRLRAAPNDLGVVAVRTGPIPCPAFVHRFVNDLAICGLLPFLSSSSFQSFDYTPRHQDDRGRLWSRSFFVIMIEEVAALAVVVSIARGHDASYPFKTIGATEGTDITAQRGAGYYLSAVEKGGEPAGTWIGNGAAKLGFKDGDTVWREEFEPLYGQFLDTRDPSRRTYLGSPPRLNAALSAIYQAKLAAHPGATADERMRLLAEARAEYDGPVGVQYFDTTFSVDKTISLAHASALASARDAQRAGDMKAAKMWEARVAGIWAQIDKSVRLYVKYMQGQSAYVRIGHHGRRIGGVETGRFEDAREIPVAIFPQHTSRDGDPQLHVHILWLNRVEAVRDGKWRSIDSRALYRNKGAGAALAAFSLETGLTRQYGFGWAYRPASKGRVIAGFPERAIAQFSSRRAQISTFTLGLAERYEKERGHAPDQRALSSMRQFANARTRKPKETGALDFAALLHDWEQTSRAAELGTLRDLARIIWGNTTPERAHAEFAGMRTELESRGELTHAQERAAMAAGIAHAQEAKAAWTRADLIHCIGQHLPDQAAGRSQEHAWQYLLHLADRAIAGEAGEEVLRLDAAEWPHVPDSLRRADGESIYRAHGSELYATRAQLSLEEQLIADAQTEAAPHLAREEAARLLRADLAQLDAQLYADAPAPDGATQGGLRLDQATAAFRALTSARRTELIVGPAGTGKTYTAVRIGQAWRDAGMGKVIGVATTSAARNVLQNAGIPLAENTAQFLGHLPDKREALGATALGAGALIILDEASTASMPDLAAVLRHASRCAAKVVITGDHAQLGAVSSGGAMEMLARKLGYAQLTEAVRFRNPWEGSATLAIRAGDVSALAAYDQHGRLHGGTYEEMAEQAALAYLAEYLTGSNVVLSAFERRECFDLSRRVQGYLLDWGKLDPGQAATVNDGARAYVGDLVVARQNDNRLQAGEPGRTLSNGDLLRVEAIGPDDMTVSRLIRPDRADDEHTWSTSFIIDKAYAREHCDLGYALTWHTVEGQTVAVSIALANDKRDRRGLYVGLSRGADRNEVFAYPSQHVLSGSDIGQPPTADPEVARERQLQTGRENPTPAAAMDSKDPIAILAPVVRRDAAELSATETREQAMSDADHLGVLHAIWMDHCRTEAHARYTQAVRDHANPADADQILKDTDRLWRTIRNAELAGLDGEKVIRSAIAGRPFTAARSHSAVLEARIRDSTGHLPPEVRESWSAGLPRLADPDVAQYMAEVAAMMDDRQRRIGEHAASEAPLWAVEALGPVPADTAQRAGWQARAGRLGSYREMFGWDHVAEAIGPEPAATSPEARAEWHAAFAVIARVEGIDVRHLSDGQLLARRRAYQAETSWAPKHVAEELRAARRQERHSKVEATRHSHEAAVAGKRGHHDRAVLHAEAARSWSALGNRAALVRERLAEAHDTRCQWEVMSEPTRRLARAADVELKRRGVLGRDDVLKSAEPEGFRYPDRAKTAEVLVQPRLDGTAELPRKAEPLDPAGRDERALQVLGLIPGSDQPELALQVTEVAEYNRQRQAEIDERRSMRLPAEEPDELDLGEAWNILAERRRDAVIQPPKPPIPPADAVVERAAEREAG